MFFIELAIGFGLVYLLLTYIKNNQKLVADKLKGLGVDIPEPTPPGVIPASATAVAPSAPAPQQKIILDDALPDPIGAPITSTSVAAPRLVRDTGEVITLANGENFVGRDTGLILSLPTEHTVSRRHAVLTKTDATVTIKDLGSTNGTFVNGNKVDSERPLSSGDAVQFGQVKFSFEA